MIWATLWRGGAGRDGCQGCAHFLTDPPALEAALPGLAILSSAHASVRGGDGLCLAHGRLTNGQRRCAAFGA
jgi:hypothetical protein